MVIALSVISLYSQTTRQEAAVIRYAKNTTVSRIELGMSKQSFDRWLRKTLGKGHPVKWEVNDCGEQTGTPADRGRDFPMCAEATAESMDVYFSVSLMVGTFETGVSRTRPQIRGIFVHVEGEGEFEVKRLSDLKNKIRELGIETR